MLMVIVLGLLVVGIARSAYKKRKQQERVKGFLAERFPE